VRKKLILLVALIALLTSGCIQADMKLDVKDDGSGTYSAVIAVNAQLFQQLGGLSALDPNAEPTSSSADICQQMIDDSQKDVPAGGKVEPYKKGDFCGVKLSAPFANIDEGIALLNGSADTGGGASLEDVTLEKKGNGWVFAAKWNPSDSGAETTGADAAMTKQFLQGFSFVVRIHLPGGQVQQNADLLEGDGTMVWNLDPTTSRTLSATTDAAAPVKKGQVLTDAGKNVGASGSAASASSATGGGGDKGSSKTWLYIVIGLVVVAAIAAIVLMKRNKAKTAPAMAGMAGMPGAPMAPGSMMSSPPMSSPPMGAPPMSNPMAPPAAPTAAPAPAAQPAAATEPQWDAARNAYIQYDNVNARWMQYDQTAGAWKPIE